MANKSSFAGLILLTLFIGGFVLYMFRSHGPQEGFSTVIALTTIAYTWVTYWLFRSSREASLAAERAYKANSVMSFTNNKRELDFYLLSNPDLLTAVYAAELKEEPGPSVKVFGDAWWLHTARFYQLLKSHMLPEEDWHSLRYGVRTLLSLPAMRKVWDKVGPAYDQEFRNFVEEERRAMESEQKGNERRTE